jgi:hypothetical protein
MKEERMKNNLEPWQVPGKKVGVFNLYNLGLKNVYFIVKEDNQYYLVDTPMLIKIDNIKFNSVKELEQYYFKQIVVRHCGRGEIIYKGDD